MTIEAKICGITTREALDAAMARIRPVLDRARDDVVPEGFDEGLVPGPQLVIAPSVEDGRTLGVGGERNFNRQPGLADTRLPRDEYGAPLAGLRRLPRFEQCGALGRTAYEERAG